MKVEIAQKLAERLSQEAGDHLDSAEAIARPMSEDFYLLVTDNAGRRTIVADAVDVASLIFHIKGVNGELEEPITISQSGDSHGDSEEDHLDMGRIH